jgi:Uma2 family endonuclease
MIVCGAPQFIDDRADTVTNPQVLIEVLSPSTALVDRNEKLREYRQFPMLQEYLLIAQSEARIERFVRQDDDNWLYTDIVGISKQVHIPSVDCMLPLAEIYSKITF